MTSLTQTSLSLGGLAVFAIGVLLGRFWHADRRITHEAPRTIQPSLVKQWRSDRLVREVEILRLSHLGHRGSCAYGNGCSVVHRCPRRVH